jgi:hypothetical protein
MPPVFRLTLFMRERYHNSLMKGTGQTGRARENAWNSLTTSWGDVQLCNDTGNCGGDVAVRA